MNPQIARYQGELKGALQLTESEFLAAENDFKAKVLRQHLEAQQRLFRCLQLEVMRIPISSRQPFSDKVKKYKEKVDQHKDFFQCKLQSKIRNLDVHQDQQSLVLNQINQARNRCLMNDRLLMEENDRITRDIKLQLQSQKKKMVVGMQVNRGLQHASQQAQSSVGLIRKAVYKRKIMFVSLGVLLVLAIVGVIAIKLRRITK